MRAAPPPTPPPPAGNAPLPQTRSYAQCYGGAPGAACGLVGGAAWGQPGCRTWAGQASQADSQTDGPTSARVMQQPTRSPSRTTCLPPGHQFGHWAGQLGDGRAICLGQAVNGEGERWELQLKVGG